MNPASPVQREFEAAYALRRAIRRLRAHDPDGASFAQFCLARAQVHVLMRYHALSHGVPLRVEPMSTQDWSEAR